MSGTTPPPGSDPGEEQNPYAQPGQPQQPPDQPWASGPPPSGPPAWSGPSEQPAWAPSDAAGHGARPEPPKSILTAVKLMYVGAGISLVLGLFGLLSRDDARDNAAESDPTLTADELDTAANVYVGFIVVVSLISVGLWLWMAAKNKAGRSWARVVATVMGGLNILFAAYALTGGGLGFVVNLISLVLAAYILYLLYRRESSEYYTAVSRTPR